ncbi:type VI secretion system baseplate subunit TssG [Saccharicrinis fermentans]|nr:type VI secretion system baseplate subunit TssG [Saccharicrinis fermentans]
MKFTNMQLHLNDIDNLQANTIDTDLKAETVAARLLSHGTSPEQVYINRKGANKRGVLKDISHITIQRDRNDPRHAAIEITTRRKGIYDALPEGVFHQTGTGAKSKSKEAILSDIRKRREEEFFNRRFFQPFEEEIDRSNIMTHLKELYFDKKNTHPEFIDIFTNYWPILKKLNQRTAAIFLEIVPLAYRIRTRYSQVAKAFSLVFEIPVQIKSNYEVHPIKANKETSLGFATLGLNFTTIGNLNDRNPDLTLVIGPMPSHRFSDFQGDGKDAKMLEILSDLLFPANSKVSTKYLFKEENNSFTLGDKNHSSLGINTYIAQTISS